MKKEWFVRTVDNGRGVNASQTLTTKSFASRSARSVRSPKILKPSSFVFPNTTILSSTRPIRLSTYGQKHLKRKHRFVSKNNEMWFFPHLAPQLFQSKFPHSFSSRARCFYLKKKHLDQVQCTSGLNQWGIYWERVSDFVLMKLNLKIASPSLPLQLA